MHSLWTTTGVEGQRERGMTASSSLPLGAIRQCYLLQAGCSREVNEARMVCQSVLGTDLCWTIPAGLPSGAHFCGPTAACLSNLLLAD
jgi:hypothetical protein